MGEGPKILLTVLYRSIFLGEGVRPEKDLQMSIPKFSFQTFLQK